MSDTLRYAPGPAYDDSMFAKLREWVDRRLSDGAAPTEPARSEFGVDAEYGRQVRARADALELAVEVEMARSRQAM